MQASTEACTTLTSFSLSLGSRKLVATVPEAHTSPAAACSSAARCAARLASEGPTRLDVHDHGVQRSNQVPARGDRV
eukprot:3383445-Pleurochrysis_carterae.AAC.2